MNDLRLLQQIDPDKKIIALEFKQITSLDVMMPLLTKFKSLETLSLHGNRLKSLPKDMSSFDHLAELDLSNNLFIDISELVESLKTIPHLRHLIISFKNAQEQNYIKNSLRQLERVNRKPVNNFKLENSFKQKRIKQSYKLSESQMENVGVLYDNIRQIYRESKYSVDKELAVDFDRSVQNIMAEITQKIKASPTETENNCHVLSGKYALIDLCFVKMITYFYHFDKKIAKVLEQIHDHQADMFKNITCLVFQQIQKQKIQITQIRTKKQQLYKGEIRRLKSYQEQNNRQINALQEQNQTLMQKLYKASQTQIMEDTIHRFANRNNQLSASKSHTSRSPAKFSNKKQNGKTVTIRSKPKNLSLIQVKELLYEIYHSKVKNNQACLDALQPLQTMQMHMYTYLNQKYGLKSLAIQWAMATVNGIRKYGMDDPEIALFGKILRNQIQQDFVESIRKKKCILGQSTKKFKLIPIHDQISPQIQISIHECEQILLYLHVKREQCPEIISKLSIIATNNLINYQQFEQIVLDFYIKKHDDKLKKILSTFREVDTDEDGIIDYQGLEEMMKKLDPKINTEAVLHLVDKSGKGIIIYSQLVHMMNKMSAEFSQCFDQSEQNNSINN